MSELHLTPVQQATKAHILSVLDDKRKEAPLSPACYLLADEVGLGKTKIAAAVIQELAKRKAGRFIVYYLCGSQRVAAQNVMALRRDCGACEDKSGTMDIRLSMQLNRDYAKEGILILPLTPATTFTNHNSKFEQNEWNYLRKQPSKLDKMDENQFLRLRFDACEMVMKKQLPPDLVLLDEFQNYDELLYKHNNRYPLFTTMLEATKYVLMLSATPYQMLSREVQHLNYRDVLTDSADRKDTNLHVQNQEEDADTFLAAKNESFDQLVQFVLDPLHPSGQSKPASLCTSNKQLYRKVFCRTERSMFYDTEIKDETVDTVCIDASAAAAHIRRMQGQYKTLSTLTKNGTADRVIAYEKKAPNYPCFSTRYVDIKRGNEDDTAVSDENYLKWDAEEGNLLPDLSNASPDSHAKYALLRDQVLPQGTEAMLWMPPVLWGEEPLPGIDRDNPFACNRDYTKTLVFGDYRMTTAAPVWYLRKEVEKRQQKWIHHPMPTQTLSTDQHAILSAYYESCFHDFPQARAFVDKLLQTFQALINAVTGLQGEESRWYYAAQGRLKEVLEEYFFLLRGKDQEEVFRHLNFLPKNMRTNSPIRKNSFITVLGSKDKDCPEQIAWAERFTEDNTDTNTHNQNHGQALQERFNSPFWPFVMTASSVAQEGLDFHWYSHAIAHWSLPKTPAEYMQREGRIDRYLSHLVRKRMHLLFPDQTSFAALDAACLAGAQQLYPNEKVDAYRQKRPLYPYWYIGKQDFCNLGLPIPPQLPNFRRLVCALPLSSEKIFWDKLQTALAKYNVHLGPSYQSNTAAARNFCPLLHKP